MEIGVDNKGDMDRGKELDQVIFEKRRLAYLVGKLDGWRKGMKGGVCAEQQRLWQTRERALKVTGGRSKDLGGSSLSFATPSHPNIDPTG